MVASTSECFLEILEIQVPSLIILETDKLGPVNILMQNSPNMTKT